MQSKSNSYFGEYPEKDHFWWTSNLRDFYKLRDLDIIQRISFLFSDMKLVNCTAVAPLSLKEKWGSLVSGRVEQTVAAVFQVFDPLTDELKLKQTAYDRISAYIDTDILLDWVVRSKEFLKGFGFIEFDNSTYEFRASNVLPHPKKYDGFDKIKAGMKVRFLAKRNTVSTDNLAVEIIIQEIEHDPNIHILIR